MRPVGDASELLAQLGWVQRLARALIRDPAAADDLAQEALRVTLSQPPGRVGHGPKLRGWLRGVARRLALDRARNEQARALREQLAAAPEGTPTTFEVVERSLRQQRVARAVLELAEPYRSTVLYRYLDELSTRDVAARMEVSKDVVRKRLERGLAQLRERLDREFGTGTRQWAVALLGLPGVAAMTTKSTLAVAAIVVAGAALAWRILDRHESPSLPAPSAPTSSSPVAAPAPTAEAPLVAERASLEERVAPPASDSHLGEADIATLLRVAVVDASGAPCRVGRLVCFSQAGSRYLDGSAGRWRDVAIAGEVTEIRLPARVGSARIGASVPGMPPAPPCDVDGLRELEDDEAPSKTVTRDVTVRVGVPLDGPTLRGAIFVDGERRVPHGLEIRLEPPHEPARIHVLDARYEAGPLASDGGKLWITSDETAPQQLKLDGDEQELDLELATGRTLTLHVVDRRDGRPLPGVELFVQSMALLERSVFRAHYREDWRFVTSGPDGIARMTGVPIEGELSIRRDDREVRRESSDARGIRHVTSEFRDPLLAIKLTPKMPQQLEETVRIDPDATRLTLKGSAAQLEPAGLVVRVASRAGDGFFARSDASISVAADGAFEIAVESDRDYAVWAEREDVRVSEVVRVSVAGRDPEPVVLAPRGGAEVTLRVVRCPAEGFVTIYVADPEKVAAHGIAVPSSGGTIERRFRLDAKAWGHVGWERTRGEKSGPTHRIELDPASKPIVEVDLGVAATERTVRVKLSEGTPVTSAQLKLDRQDDEKQGTINLLLVDGECRRATSIPSGRYLATLIGVPGVVLEMIEVHEGPADVPLELTLHVDRHPRSELGVGVKLTDAPTKELRDWLRAINGGVWKWEEFPSYAEAETLVLPSGVTFEVLDE